MSKAMAYAEDKSRNGWLNMTIGSFVSIIISLVLILVFALLIKWFNLSDAVITPANIVIKIISIAIGVLFVCKDGQRGVIRGSILGVLYIALCFGVFSLLNGALIFTMSLVYDLFLGLIAGGVLGVIVVNLKR